MTGKHRIIVSSENNPYLAWQTKLLYFSSVSRLHHQPIIIVHDSGKGWDQDFYDLVRAGATVRSAPSYRVTGSGDDYACRNQPGTLLHAVDTCNAHDEFIVFCDTDMIFVRPPDFLETLSGEFYPIMDYNREAVDVAAKRLGITREMINAQREELRCGPPYVIPMTVAGRLAEVWLEAIDALPPRLWQDSMYGFGLAAVKLGLKVTLTHMMDKNRWRQEEAKGDVIHYCHGDDTWNKRHYFTEAQARSVWEPAVEAQDGTILSEILSQIRQAKEFFQGFSF